MVGSSTSCCRVEAAFACTRAFGGMMVQAYIMYYALAIGGGAPNIQRNVIGERGLGLPRDNQR